jgi:exonuclease SbcC
MRLAHLELQNFRSFQHTKLHLEADGLIGVRGANGAGKSSLFEGVEFALYGKRHSGPPVRRTGARRDEPFNVALKFYFEDHLIEVERNEDTASFIVDGREMANSLSAATHAAVRQLGLTREQFIATFYARQKEIQAFAKPNRRRENIERLLGLTQVRLAAGNARKDAAAQATVVSALAEDLEDVAEAKRLLAERRERAKALAPPAEQARFERDSLAAERDAAWDALTTAQEQAKAGQAAQAEARVAAEREQVIRKQVEELETATSEAAQASTQLAALAPLASQCAERRARVAELDLREQAYAQYLAAREARADAQRRQANLTDQLDDLPPPTPGSVELAASLDESRSQLDQTRAQLVDSTEAEREIGERLRLAKEAATLIKRVAELDQLLDTLPELESEEQQAQERQFALEGQRVELERALNAEREHRAEVERDGPDARCIRCRRHYGDRYDEILTEFTKLIADLEKQHAQVLRDLSGSRETLAGIREQMGELRRLEGERASLRIPGQAPENAEALAEKLLEAKTLSDRLRNEIEAHIARESSLQETLKQAHKRESERQGLIDAIAQARAEEDAYKQQLAGITVDSYDETEHEDMRAQLLEAEDAEQRCSALRTRAQQLELMQRRHAAALEELHAATKRSEQAQELAAGYERSADALEQAKQHLRAMDEQMRVAEAKVLEAEQRAISESKDVEAAEEAVKRALAQRRRLRTAQRESRYLDAVAKLLDEYASHAQRRALPTLEKDAAQLLTRLSGGLYNDVRLDEKAALQIYDDGEHRSLERFSGGEQDLSHLCLRLALSRTFARQRGTDAGLIILDEVFGSQDLDRRRALLDQLRDLDKEFAQVFIVSHFDDVVAVCDLQINVERVNGVSEAKAVS